MTRKKHERTWFSPHKKKLSGELTKNFGSCLLFQTQYLSDSREPFARLFLCTIICCWEGGLKDAPGSSGSTPAPSEIAIPPRDGK
jgi:hypothetical protein